MDKRQVMIHLAGQLFHEFKYEDVANGLMDVVQADQIEPAKDEEFVLTAASVIAEGMDDEFDRGRRNMLNGIIQAYRASVGYHVTGKNLDAEQLAAVRSFEAQLEALTRINLGSTSFKARSTVDIMYGPDKPAVEIE